MVGRIKNTVGRLLFFPLFLLSLAGLTPQTARAATAPQLDIVKPAVECATLRSLDLTEIGGKGSLITSAQVATVNNSQWCQIEGTLAPEIGFKLLLPTENWSRRYMQLGCGGLCGQINLQAGAAAGCAPLQDNAFALASSDMGHSAQEDDFGKDRQKRSDFAWRGVHLTAVAAKKLIAAYYHQPAAWSYFNGCSDGGREALMEAQRFPLDFNGIIAGAAAMNFQAQNALYHAWQVISNRGPDGKALITAAQLPMIHQAVLTQCDMLDGQQDGLIADPQSCQPDFSPLRCDNNRQNADGQCLTDAQLTALHKLYDGPREAKSGKKLIVAGPQYGSELAWEGVFIPRQADGAVLSQSISLSSLRYMNFTPNPSADFTLQDLKFDQATFARLSKLHALYDATNPDLRAFAEAGGKLIIWHGWADPHISPLNSIAYHQALGQEMGETQRQRFERLYLLPGVYHCSGGEGPSLVDFLTPMMNWVEQGTAPDGITAWQASPRQHNSFGQPTSAAGKPAKMPAKPQEMRVETIPAHTASRPVYPYPEYAVYSGSGEVDRASSYVRRALPTIHNHYAWLGEDFYHPYAFMK
ncbi:tannase/feruloyl esterase family alpha/beta hydrolase [Brenneria sp. 4F2]|nr:tannase/feruloyl esterase family alpha/beta hydrolase [Brenneria bubanii]